jgi:guanylate kinase
MEDKLQEAIKNYHPSPETIELVRRVPLLLFVGISGAGKDTIKHRLLNTGNYYNYISHTTRAPRENKGKLEVDGEDYFFITREKALEMLQGGEFIEAKNYSGNIYGTSRDGLRHADATGKIAINDIEVQGVDEYKSISNNVIAIFLLPPSYEEWKHRLMSRYAESDLTGSNMNLRIETAAKELRHALSKNYYHFVINDDLDVAVDACDQIAHSRDSFHSKDEDTRKVAEGLLAEIESSL